MFGRIYLKLYFSFVVVFLITLFVVVLIYSGFYASRVREEVEDYFVSHARFLETAYLDACGNSTNVDSEGCKGFIHSVGQLQMVHFWILDRSGRVLVSQEKHSPVLKTTDLEAAASGQIVTMFHRKAAPRVILPIRSKSGEIDEILVLERSFFKGSHLPGFPLIFSLLAASLVIALLVHPLSLRLTRPIRALHQLGREWAEGRLERRATVVGSDEIADLARVFNTMAENLQNMLQQRKEFLAFISHELKSPLARMRIALELLSEKETLPDATVLKLVRGIEADIAESEKLIEQLLDLSRIEMSLPSVNVEQVNLAEILQEARDQITPMADDAGVRIRMEEQQSDLPVVGDGAQLQRAISNILENAVKFSSAGSMIEVRVSRQEGTVRLEVLDQGSGIHPDELDRIFEPFFRGRVAVKKEGSGLGLFLARRIVEAHHGKITAAPNSPTGAVITIELPTS